MYNPDKWLMVKLTNVQTGKVHHRIFATWAGGYTTGDSWKLNSGINKITEDGDHYLFEGASGSVYRCRKNMYGSTGYGWATINSMVEESKEFVNMEILPEPENIFEIVLES
jgi:hypothetical protein